MSLCLFLSVSAPIKADTSIDDILATSGTLVTKINYGIQGIAGAEYYAQLGGIAPTDFLLTDGAITEQERIAYMDALSVVQGSTYYDAAALVADYEDDAWEDVTSALNQYVEATLAIAQVVRVNQLAEDADTSGDVKDAQRVQDYINQNEAEVSLTSEEVETYNVALEEVGDYIQVAAAWSAMAGDAEMLTTIDETAAGFDLSVVDTTLVWDAAGGTITATYNQQAGATADRMLRQSVFDMTGYFKTVSELLTAGEEQDFYTTSPTGNPCFYVPSGVDGC